jgi:uncharacterized phage protein (TIGR02218 family)
MRSISPQLASHLASGATTLCQCWKLIRRDGQVFGFTDHDRDLVFAGTSFSAASGLEGSEAESQLGLSIGGGEVSGVLMASAISEADVLAGRLDGASIESWLVNWQDVEERVLLDIGTVGEIRRSDESFTLELRGPAAEWDEERGRTYIRSCTAELGDQACGIALASSAYTETATLSLVADGQRLTMPQTASAAGWFTHGIATLTSGAASGVKARIIGHERQSGQDTITLDRLIEVPVAAGDTVSLVAGCDKSFETCKAKFANGLNFRGFPHLPSADRVFSYAERGAGKNDGKSLFK